MNENSYNSFYSFLQSLVDVILFYFGVEWMSFSRKLLRKKRFTVRFESGKSNSSFKKEKRKKYYSEKITRKGNT